MFMVHAVGLQRSSQQLSLEIAALSGSAQLLSPAADLGPARAIPANANGSRWCDVVSDGDVFASCPHAVVVTRVCIGLHSCCIVNVRLNCGM